MKNEPQIREYAEKILKRTIEELDDVRVHHAFKNQDPRFLDLSSEMFRQEFRGARLALAARAWERACLENGLGGENILKMLLRVVMNSFGSQENVDEAEVFSAYYQAPRSEEDPSVAACQLFFDRVGRHDLADADKGQISPAFQILIALSESFRAAFENKFFDFFNT